MGKRISTVKTVNTPMGNPCIYIVLLCMKHFNKEKSQKLDALV